MFGVNLDMKLTLVATVMSLFTACQETVPPVVYQPKDGTINSSTIGANQSDYQTSDTIQNLGGSNDGSNSDSNDAMPLPTQTAPSTTESYEQETTTNTTYFQSPEGILLHPDLRGGAPITGGVMNVTFAPTQVSLTINGMTTSKHEAKKGVSSMNGSTTFEKVRYTNLPDKKKYKDHPYLIFANAVTNKDNQRFTVTGRHLIPIYASAKDTVEAYANLIKKGTVRYPTTVVGPDGTQAAITFTVTRTMDGYLPSCPSHPFNNVAATLAQVGTYFGVKIVATGIPQNWFGKFPMTDTIYVNQFANGGSTKAIATCREIYDSERRKRGSVKLEFAQ